MGWILHVDMDAFYASVEALDDPSLAGRPVIVGGHGPRGVVASCSYEARSFGVRSAMPSVQARRLCPQATFVRGRYDRYAEVSKQMHAVFRRYTPVVEGISLDEAFLDVSGAGRLFGSARDIARGIRAAVSDEMGLSCSVGASTVKFLAKLASESAKPRAGAGGGPPVPGRGIFVVEAGQELAFLHPHPIEALWGVGPATAARLRRLGVVTVGDLARLPETTLETTLGRAHGAQLGRLAHGIDDRPVIADREVKSISHEETWAVDRRDADGLQVEVLRMSDSVASRLRQAGLVARTVNLKLRYGDFTTHTRSTTPPRPVATASRLAELAGRLLADFDLAPGVRLLGVGVSNLSADHAAPAEQLSLGWAGTEGSDPDVTAPGSPTAAARAASSDAADAVDAVRRRFGPASIGPAALISPAGLRVKRQGEAQWGPEAE